MGRICCMTCCFIQRVPGFETTSVMVKWTFPQWVGTLSTLSCVLQSSWLIGWGQSPLRHTARIPRYVYCLMVRPRVYCKKKKEEEKKRPVTLQRPVPFFLSPWHDPQGWLGIGQSSGAVVKLRWPSTAPRLLQSLWSLDIKQCWRWTWALKTGWKLNQKNSFMMHQFLGVFCLLFFFCF